MSNAQPVTAGLEGMMKNFEKLRDETKKFRELCEQRIEKEKPKKRCEIHKLFFREVDVDKTVTESWFGKKFVVVFKPCPTCAEKQQILERNGWLKRRGVPENMITCSFKGFKARSDEDTDNLAAAQKFAKARTGFFVMLSPLNLIGNGKSHLAVSILREHERGLFITSSDLFEKIRFGFTDRAKIIDLCKMTLLLVIDEFGVSPGYKDEAAIMHDILSTRHNNKRKTVLTGNFANKEEFYEAIGERMKDRLKESGFKLLWFSGESMRPKMKEKYLDE